MKVAAYCIVLLSLMMMIDHDTAVFNEFDKCQSVYGPSSLYWILCVWGGAGIFIITDNSRDFKAEVRLSVLLTNDGNILRDRCDRFGSLMPFLLFNLIVIVAHAFDSCWERAICLMTV